MSSAARIEELQKKFDENPRRYFAPLANECRKAGDLDAAIAICRTHLPQQPGHMSGHIVYGQALFESGELDEARTVFETALGLDPENLIALRHMGDIAARHGDMAAARQWYVRVLETDPRNEEIQTLVAGLETGTADSSFDDDAPRVRGGLPSLVDPALLAAAAEAVPVAAVPESEVPGFDAGEFHAPEPAVDDIDLTGFDPRPLVTTEAEAATASDTPREELLEPTVLEFEAPAMDSATLEGLEATTFEAPAADEVSSYERVGDEALLDETEAPAAAVDGLESMEFDASGYGGSGLETIAAPSFEFEPADAAPIQDPPAAPPSGEAFATETMAELYLRQGYRDEALGVYRKLVIQSPDDSALRSRMERLEAEIDAEVAADPVVGGSRESDPMEADGDDVIAGLPQAIDPELLAVAAEAQPEERQPSAPAASGGPTIRQFLAALATGSALPSHQPEGEIADVVDLGEFEVTDAASDLAEPEVELPGDFFEPAEGPPAADRQPVRGEGLDALFGSAATEDARAADVLAAAYQPADASVDQPAAELEADPLRGRPARPAGNDLSLDAVFGAPRQQGTPRNTGGFSFDQFFAEGAVKPVREEAPEQPAATGDEEDLEQFNSWLHNLRKP